MLSVLHGAMHDFSECEELMYQVPETMKRKSYQLEMYVVRKVCQYLRLVRLQLIGQPRLQLCTSQGRLW